MILHAARPDGEAFARNLVGFGRVLRRAGIPVVPQQAAVAARVGCLEAEDHHRGAVGTCREQRLQGLGADEGRVAVEADRVAGEVFERGRGLEHRVAGAELLGLLDHADVRIDRAAGCGYRRAAVAGDEDGTLGLEAAGGG